jgi:hypothetical protein
LPDEPTDPHYGEPLAEHWQFPENPATPERINPEVAKLIEDPDAMFGRAPDGHAYTQAEYEERFNQLSDEGKHYQNFPGNAGAVPGSKAAFDDLGAFREHYGSEVDRIGVDEGKYLAVVENGIPASWESRALHVNSLGDPYKSYRIDYLPEGWTIEASEVSPGLGQPGQSIQVRFRDESETVIPVQALKELGILK